MEREHSALCPRAQFWDAGEFEAPCLCDYIDEEDEGEVLESGKEYIHNGRDTPGGDLAIDRGCTCPVLDNNYGLGIGDGQFWMNAECPIHGNKSPI